MTKEQAFKDINQTQEEYIDELVKLINSPDYEIMKTINFTSPTGTGKTKMMSKLINKFPEYYFIITSLSKGQLHYQIYDSLEKDCNQKNFVVYGTCDYKINSKLQAEDIISNIPENTKCIWLRDEGHIKTNRFDELLINVCYKVINFSATNTNSDIKCNFTHTMMLRTVHQNIGTPEDAILKLLEVKKIHKNVPNYNPCAIFRIVGESVELCQKVKELCEEYGLEYIDISNEDYIMADLCEDNNEYDVILNKFKIVEGIDIRRAHILYMDNQPKNNATTIQVIGRCRRNALLYRNDIDIFAPENKELLKQTRQCYTFYNVPSMRVDTDEHGELCYAFCDHVSCESLKPNTEVEVINGQLFNGLYITELAGMTGTYKIEIDKDTDFNIVAPITDFYKEIKINISADTYVRWKAKNIKDGAVKIVKDVDVSEYLSMFDTLSQQYTKEYIYQKVSSISRAIYVQFNPHYIGNDIRSLCLNTLKLNNKHIIITTKDIYNLLAFDKIIYKRIGNAIDFDTMIKNYFEQVDFILNKNLDSKHICIISEPFAVVDAIFYCIRGVRAQLTRGIPVQDYYRYPYKSFEKTINDKESAIIGCDEMHQIKDGYRNIQWVESKAISSKVGKYNKLNTFLSQKYSEELAIAREQLFNGENLFDIDKKCNSAIGYCVEYYSKYLVYGKRYLNGYIKKTVKCNNDIIVEACMCKYRDMMKRSFGPGVAKIIKTVSVSQLIGQQRQYFVNLVVELGTKTANFVKSNLYPNGDAKDDIDPNLSIKHITGLADYITQDTILDVKVRNNIDEKCVRQVLAYHYLSTKRSDLCIKKVIVYDAVSDKAVIVNIGEDNVVKNRRG